MSYSPWFPMRIKPARDGLYDVRMRSSPEVIIRCLYWGPKTFPTWLSADRRQILILTPGLEWRGLAEQPT